MQKSYYLLQVLTLGKDIISFCLTRNRGRLLTFIFPWKNVRLKRVTIGATSFQVSVRQRRLPDISETPETLPETYPAPFFNHLDDDHPVSIVEHYTNTCSGPTESHTFWCNFSQENILLFQPIAFNSSQTYTGCFRW